MWGTVGSGLTPRVRKHGRHPGFPALISVGGTNRFLKDLSPDMPGIFFGKYFAIKVVKYAYFSHLKVFLHSQDHPDHHGSLQQVPGEPEPGHPQRLIF